MTKVTGQERRRIFREELEQLEAEKFLTKEEFDDIMEAHYNCFVYLRDGRVKQTEREESTVQKPDLQPQPQSKPPAIKRSPQEIRDRNITWSLNLGVILLLIGGLVLGTSTWSLLGDWMKTGLIGLVSLMFFGLALFTTRILKIEKTAFAFYVLGSLFLPIVIFSAGYFELFGPYLSVTGEGRYLFGVLGSLLMLPLFILLANHLSSRLFIWFSYVMLSVLGGFFLAALYLPIDGFYLGMMLFNSALIIGYQYFKADQRFKRFMNEFTIYIQGNLILSTLFMLVFYNHELIHGFNLLITALIYFSMIYITNHKEYHFVFSVMLIYGAYQVIEFSALYHTSGIAYALLGFIFLVIPLFIKDQHSLQRTFQYTSAVVSSCAFIYISLEGILIHLNTPSLVLFVAYLIVSLNFIFLSNLAQHILFYYLSPVFFVVAWYELLLLSQVWFGIESLVLPLFISMFVFCIVMGGYVRTPFLEKVKDSSRDVSLFVMIICVLVSLLSMDWWQAGTMFLLFSVIALFMDEIFPEAHGASWIHPATIGIAVILYYGSVADNLFMKGQISPVPAENLVLSGLVLLLIGMVWKLLKRTVFYDRAFIVANGFYTIGILHTFSPVFDDLLRVLIFFGGVGMFYILYRKTKVSELSFAVSGLVLFSYLSLLHLIDTHMQLKFILYDSLQWVVGALLLFTISLLLERNDPTLKNSFSWIGHIYLPIALIISVFSSGEAVWAFGMATVIYVYSLSKARVEWMMKSFLYASFTTFWLSMALILILLDLERHLHYSFLIASVVFSICWYISKGSWTRRIAYYLAPFSLIGVMAFTLVLPFDLTMVTITILYAAGLLFIFHKETWDIFNFIPILFVYYSVISYGNMYLDSEYGMIYLLLAFVLLLTVTGWLLYKQVYKEGDEESNPFMAIDMYTIVGFIGLWNLYFYRGEALWTLLLPGILITAFIILQRNRIPFVESRWFVAGGIAYLLQPYYALLGYLEIPSLIEREVYVLPFVGLVLLIKRVATDEHKTTINNVQWGVLVIVSVLLMEDALASSTIYDALLLGSLALVSMLAGFILQMKSFFFVGFGVLLLNVFLQTRMYWGNLPWWAYLLIAGTILITVASYNEWQKQKTTDGKETLLSIFKKKVIDKLKKWD